MITNLLNSIWELIHKQQNGTYGLAEVYDSLVSEGYFDYGKIANTLHSTFGGDSRLNILELCIGSGNLALLLSDKYSISGVDKCPIMLSHLKQRIEVAKTTINIQQNDIECFDFEFQFDFIYSHSADPLIFWLTENNDLELAVNSKEQLRKIAENVARHLKKNGRFLVNIENKHIEFPSRFIANIISYKYNDLGHTRKIYEVKDIKTGTTHLHTSQKEARCTFEESTQIFNDSGLVFTTRTANNTFCIFTKK